MADGASSKTTVVVALIGATTTIVVALIPFFWPAPKPHPPAPAPIVNTGAVQAETTQGYTSASKSAAISRKPNDLSGGPTRNQETAGGVPAKVNLAAEVALIKEYLKANSLNKAADTVRIALQKQPSNGELHACLGSLSIAAGQIDQAEREFTRAGQLGVPGMLDHAASVKVHEAALKELISYRSGDDVTAAEWKAYDEVHQAQIPGTSKMMYALNDGTGDEIERRASEGSLPDHRQLNQLNEWHQAAMSKPGIPYYCPSP